ncbi:MAG: hypothetical protein M3Z80_01750 [Apibacter sp.]|nr:hypothetical protein [Apibacter sp.]MCT6868654.1 hypothetical protein [Apibacter sp.]
MIIYFPYLFYGDFQGMTIFPFIFIRYKYLKHNKILINHEKIHLRQQLEMLWIFFFICYLVEYIINLIKYKNTNIAYHKISFEREAYINDKNMKYLNKRKIWAFIKYLK